ncbi:MAG: hypothetical protein OXI86_21400 [Candidatus Poribacteria bacterium]|nr:hypothetical protein [Candidatus Poribacteria bacterium]
MRKCAFFNIHVLICITMLIFTGCGVKQTEATLESPNYSRIAATSEPSVPVDPDSVLSVIPSDVNGLIYIRNPLALNEEINALFAELVMGEPPQEIVADILAETFGAGFESLEELEELGLNLGKDFCVFFTGTETFIPGAAVHVKDPEAIKLVINAESDVDNTVEYNGTTYNTTEEGGAFVILGDFLVYSEISSVCETAIDAHTKAIPSIGMNADYASLKIDPSLEQNDILAYFPMAPIVEMLTKRAHGMQASLESMEASVPDPAGLTMVSRLMDWGIQFLDQATTLSITVELDGTDLQISPFLKFKDGSDAQTLFRSMPTELTHLDYLSRTSFANSMMQFDKETWIDLTVDIMKMMAPTDPDADNQAIQQTTKVFLEALSDFYEPIGEEASGTFSFGGSLLPDMVLINDILDEQQMATYMKEDYLSYISAAESLYRAMGAKDAANMYSGASPGASETYNDVEIMSITLPNISAGFAEMPPEMSALIPEKWDIHHAIYDGKLLISLAATTLPIKDALDRMAGTEFSNAIDMVNGKVIDTMTLKNNWLFTLSPIALVNGALQAVAQSDPQGAGMMGMFLQNAPDTHCIGIAGHNRDGGVQVKIFFALADLQPLINIGTMMQQAMQMQEMQPMQ